MDYIDNDRDYRLQQLEDFILNHQSELSVDSLLVRINLLLIFSLNLHHFLLLLGLSASNLHGL